jgi:ABC-2 type transport system permease protein
MTPPDAVAVLADPPIVDVPVASHRPRSLVDKARKYVKILRVSLVERMTYRADFLLGTVLRFLPMITTILLWEAIYKGSGRSTLSGFRFNEMIAYLLLVNISRMFSSMPGLAGGIARDIREGTLKKYLLQPLDMIWYLNAYRLAHKAAYIVASALPYGLLFFLCRQYFHGLVPTDLTTWLAFFASLGLAFLVGFYFEVSVGMVGFWFLEVTSILYIVMTLNFFVSGHMFPLDLLPPFWSELLKGLPFSYLAYLPAVVFLGKIKGWELVWRLALGALWAGAFMLLSRWLYRLGLKRYSAFGG